MTEMATEMRATDKLINQIEKQLQEVGADERNIVNLSMSVGEVGFLLRELRGSSITDQDIEKFASDKCRSWFGGRGSYRKGIVTGAKWVRSQIHDKEKT